MGNGPARPSIRPVTPAPPPPRPAAKQRKIQSGFAPKTPMREPYGSNGDHPTAIAEYEPPTQSKPRTYSDPMAFDDETQARPVDDHLLAQSRGIDAPYESLPSLEVRRPFDTYEHEFSERDPAASRVPPPQRSRQQLREEPSYPIPVEIGSGARQRPVPSPWDERREASGPQARAWESPAEPVIPPAPRVPHDARPISSPPFVMGVQPLRTPHAAYTPVPQPMPQTMPPRADMRMQQQMQQMHAQQMQMQMHAQMQQRAAHQQQQHQMIPRPAGVATGPALHRQPVGPSLQTDTQEGSKAGRFAWFVFGAAFGIAFAFFATGFVPRIGGAKDPEPLFPPAAPLPAATTTATATATPPASTTTAPAATATPPATTAPAATTAAPAPMAPPTAAAPAVAPPTTAVAAPPATVLPGVAVAPPIVAPAPTVTATATSPLALPPAPATAFAAAPPPPVKAAAPAPTWRRTWSPPPSPRRPAPPAEAAGPKPLQTAPTAPASEGSGDLGDILGGALKP